MNCKSNEAEFLGAKLPKRSTVGTVEVVLSGGHPPIDYRVN